MCYPARRQRLNLANERPICWRAGIRWENNSFSAVRWGREAARLATLTRGAPHAGVSGLVPAARPGVAVPIGTCPIQAAGRLGWESRSTGIRCVEIRRA